MGTTRIHRGAKPLECDRCGGRGAVDTIDGLDEGVEECGCDEGIVQCDVDRAHGFAVAKVDNALTAVCLACLVDGAEAGEEENQRILAELTGRAAA